MKKFLIGVIVLGIFGLVGWQIYQKVYGPQENTRRRFRSSRVAVEIKPVQTATIRDVKNFTGTLYPRAQFIVAPKISGRMKKLMFNIGDTVKPGQVIAELDDEEFLQEVDQSRATLAVAKANLEESRSALEIAKRELERTTVLRQKKIASESELDGAQARYNTQEAKLKVAQAQVVQKEAELKVGQVRLSYTKIEVPPDKSGSNRVVGERYVHEGALLSPNKPILSILDITYVIAAIHVIERDYTKIQTGMEGTILTDAFPDRTFSGRVARMAPLLKEASRQALVEIEIENVKGLLKPGMFVKVQIEFDRHDNATVIPIESLTKRDGKEGIFVVDDQQETARFLPVTTGIVDGNRIEILAPALSGSVITLGQHLLEDGAAIIVPADKEKKPAPPTSAREKKKKKKNKTI
ncbi:MAG: efflux RND transporter periplasmic adaptor subunit [Desulfobacterales bacterium]|nr:efflux RND transporter periplasmic adaptor subunit [Desulfobacterales bacterium]